MRDLSRLTLLLTLAIVMTGCGKRNVPQQDYSFKFKVAIANKITEPTIINGYYGTMNRYSDGPESDPETTKNCILLYEVQHKEALDAAVVQKNGTTFYDLRKLKKSEVEPKFIIIPNKKGFYQVDTNDKSYYALIQVKRNLGYYNGGVTLLNQLSNELRELEMRVDY